MIPIVARRLRMALGIPDWWPYLAAVVLAGLTYWYIDSTARTQERERVAAEFVVAAREKELAAQKHFAERASQSAAAIVALQQVHAAELVRRDALEQDLIDAWKDDKAKDADATTCWPTVVVKELRR